MGIQGRSFIVTGSGRGIGAATAKLLATKGAAGLALWSRSADVLKSVAEEIRSRFPKIKIVEAALDVGNERQVQEAFVKSLSALGSIDGLVNNAAIFSAAPAEETSLSEFRELFRVNVDGVFLCAREFINHRKATGGGGVIVTVSSIAGIEGSQKFPGLSAYSATKSAVIGLAEAWAEELRSLKIRSNVVAPGATDTDMLRKAFPQMKADLSPEDVAGAILKLIEDEKANGEIVEMAG